MPVASTVVPVHHHGPCCLWSCLSPPNKAVYGLTYVSCSMKLMSCVFVQNYIEKDKYYIV